MDVKTAFTEKLKRRYMSNNLRENLMERRKSAAF